MMPRLCAVKIICAADLRLYIIDNHYFYDLKFGSHDPFFVSNYLSGIVSAHRNVDSRH